MEALSVFGSGQVDEKELHFLILHYLASGPCQNAFQALQQDAANCAMLPKRIDIFGKEHPMSYPEMKQIYGHIPPAALRALLEKELCTTQWSCRLLEGMSSVLNDGPGRLGRYPFIPPKQHQHMFRSRSAFKHILSGVSPESAGRFKKAAATPVMKALKHLKTVRGHRSPVYCLTIDRVGRLAVTGADDTIIKFWSLQTGMLLMVGRGHEAEVTDLAVSCDNAVVASSSNDCSIRIWSLKAGEVGYPSAVLLGHTGPVSYVDFHRTVSTVLLSSSFDGTCRIWDVAVGGGCMFELQAAVPAPPIAHGLSSDMLLGASSIGLEEDLTNLQADTAERDRAEHENQTPVQPPLGSSADSVRQCLWNSPKTRGLNRRTRGSDFDPNAAKR